MSSEDLLKVAHYLRALCHRVVSRPWEPHEIGYVSERVNHFSSLAYKLEAEASCGVF